MFNLFAGMVLIVCFMGAVYHCGCLINVIKIKAHFDSSIRDAFKLRLYEMSNPDYNGLREDLEYHYLHYRGYLDQLVTLKVFKKCFYEDHYHTYTTWLEVIKGK